MKLFFFLIRLAELVILRVLASQYDKNSRAEGHIRDFSNSQNTNFVLASVQAYYVL